VAAADGAAVRELAGCDVSVGDTERVGVAVGVVVGGAVVGVGSDEVEACPVGEWLPAVEVDAGLKST
jgi:hypothetical protein